MLTAEVYDYNEVGFTEGGVHTRTHYFTMVCGSDGRYRFVSKRSQIIDPAQVSVEGYFLSIGQIGEITPEIEAEFALTQAGILVGIFCSIISSTPHRGIRCTCMGSIPDRRRDPFG